MPAEWEPHAATWLGWPHQRADWPGKFAPIPWVYGEIIRHITAGERVRLLVQDAATEKQARKLLARVGVNLAKIDFIRQKTNRVWTRDYGPIYVRRGREIAITNWKFNGWAKYGNHRLDDAIPDTAAARQKRRQWKPELGGRRIVLEGGSIDVNGAGTLLTTEECLLSPIQARNPGVSRDELEQIFADYLGIRKVLWLGDGIVGDDTHGHVDDLARFVDSTTVVVASERNRRDDNYTRLADARRRLQRMSNADGRRLNVVELPMPRALALDGQRLPASYANFYICNAAVLVPTFNDPSDRIALDTLAKLFPSRDIIGIHAVDLVWGLGTLHCLSQQEPA
jgi:agmatine deiminase